MFFAAWNQRASAWKKSGSSSGFGERIQNKFYLGKAMFNQKLYEKSVPLFKKAILAKPESSGVYFLLAQSLYFAKKYRESLSFFKKALDEDPSNKEALFNMSDAMFQEGRGDRAIKIFMHLRADPVYGARSCLRAGVFHTKINDLNAAIQDYEIGLKHENEPSDIRVEIEYNLARCYFEKKQIAKGLALLKSIRNSVQNYKRCKFAYKPLSGAEPEQQLADLYFRKQQRFCNALPEIYFDQV